MLKIIFSSIISCSLLYGQSMAQASKIDSSEMRTLRVDPYNAKGATASEVFEEVNYIPLETTKESQFGAITRIRVIENNFIIWDYDTKAILIFTKQGKYVGKINGSKMKSDAGDQGNQDFFGFDLITENNQQLIRVLAGTGKYYFYFDLTAKLIRKVNSEDDKDGSQLKFSDGTVVDLNYSEKKEKNITNYEISLVKDKEKIESYFPYSPDKRRNDPYSSPLGSITNYGPPDELFFVNAYEYNVYRVTPKKLSLAYRMIFPTNNSLPEDFKDNPIYFGKRQDYFDKHPNTFYGIGNNYQIGDNLYFQASTWHPLSDVKKSFIYNLKKNTLISIADIEPDSLSQFLPLTDAGVQYEFSIKGFHWFDGNYFYTSYSSLMLFNFKKQSENNNRKYNPVLTTYFKTQNIRSNPVLIQLKPRKN